MLQTLEPHTGTRWPVCNKSPESVKSVGSALWNNPAVIPNRVGFVKLSQIGVFVDSINKIRGCKTPGCDGNLVPVAVKSTGMGGGLSVWFGCDGCKTRYENEPADISVSVNYSCWLHSYYVFQDIAKCYGYEDCECTCVSKHN